jgi:hypothetical protein
MDMSPTEKERTCVAPSFFSVEMSSSSAWNSATVEAKAGKPVKKKIMNRIKLRMALGNQHFIIKKSR